MTENETILISLIRQHKNPEQALLTAIQVILWSLEHPEASSEMSPPLFRNDRTINH